MHENLPKILPKFNLPGSSFAYLPPGRKFYRNPIHNQFELGFQRIACKPSEPFPINARGKGAKGKTGSAEVALGYIEQLDRIEQAGRAADLSASEIQQLRIDRAEPVLEEFKAWIETRN